MPKDIREVEPPTEVLLPIPSKQGPAPGDEARRKEVPGLEESMSTRKRISQSKPLKPSIMWAIFDGKTARSTRGILGMAEDDQDVPVGTYFGAVFFRRKLARNLAAKWPGAVVKKVWVEEAYT
jgi:hypothetical protein